MKWFVKALPMRSCPGCGDSPFYYVDGCPNCGWLVGDDEPLA